MIGSTVGNFQILDKLGEGGMGAVYLGVDLMIDRRVALKMLRSELARDPHVVQRFRSEAVTLARINHPRVATLYSFFRDRDDYFMVMEYVEGEPLDRTLSRSGAMPPARAVSLLCQALEGIDHAHRLGIVHRDLKPANLMLLPDDTVKVMDFGIARVLGTSRMTRTGRLIGTVEYMSPEQVRGLEADAVSDIYSLGVVLFEMLTGRIPFQADSEYDLMRAQLEEIPPTPRAFAPGTPVAVESAVMRALAKDPASRFASAADFRTALLDITFAGARQRSFVPPPKPTRDAGVPASPPAFKLPRLRVLSSEVKYYIGAAMLLAASTIVALILTSGAAPADKAAQPQPAHSPAEERRPSSKPPTEPPVIPAAASPAAAPQAAPVQRLAEDDAAERERERRRAAAAARRRAAEHALDLR